MAGVDVPQGSEGLDGQVALVTGGGTGFGSVVSKDLAAAGAVVAIGYSRSGDDAEQTRSEIEAAGGVAATFQSDLQDTSNCERLVAAVAERFGRLDVLVNNAATTVRIPFTQLDDLEESDWDRVMALNVKVPWLLTRAATPHLRDGGRGAVVNITSTAAYEPAGSLVYSVSKAALVNLTEVMARILAPEIRVNSVAPGMMFTRWTSHYSEDAFEAFRHRSLLQRTVPLEDAAAVVRLLATNHSITGQTYLVDGGATFRPPER